MQMQRRDHVHVCSDIDDESSSKKKKKQYWRKEMAEARDKYSQSQGTRNNDIGLEVQVEVVRKGKINEADDQRRGVSVTTRCGWLGKLKIRITWSKRQELCKKRILLGGRCKPLATIQYDENGFLLPEPEL